MKTFKQVKQIQQYTQKLKKQEKSIGLVPTMGALHRGHLSLVHRARKENDVVVVSIFVNPTQFGPNEDYLRYPRPVTKDLRLCHQAGVDIVFNPSIGEMYPENYLTYVNVEKLSEPMCGKFRTGHFRGVATVVTKLFNIIQPTSAYFGEKDYQQVQIIKQIIKDLNLPIKIIPCPIVREQNGLAMSSRNVYLSQEERARALSLSQALNQAKEMVLKKSLSDADTIKKKIRDAIAKSNPSKIDYITIADAETLEEQKTIKGSVVIAVAVWYSETRLIDNVRVRRL